MKKIPLVLILAALVAAPLRVSAMEDREEEKGKDGSGGDHTGRNSRDTEYQADKAAAAI